MTQRRSKAWQAKALVSVDSETGELVPGYTVHVPRKVHVGNYVTLMQEGALAVALDRDLTLSALRVLKYLESTLGYESAIPIIQNDVVKTLGMYKSDVSKAFKLLRSKGIIERIECPALKPVYRFNPHYGWRGKHDKWLEEKNKARPLTLLKGGQNEKIPRGKIFLELEEDAS